MDQDGCNDAIVDQVDKDSPEVRSGRSSRAVVKVRPAPEWARGTYSQPQT